MLHTCIYRYILYLVQQYIPGRQHTVIMREMAPSANGFFLIFLVFFCAPRRHLTDECHLTHTGAIMQLNDFIQGLSLIHI